MAENTENASGIAQVAARIENKAAKPLGLLPKNAQQLVILGVAVVMVLIMWLTGGTKRARTAPAPPPEATVQAPNPATVEDFKHTLQQEQAATRQPISQTNLERLQAVGLAGDVPPGTAVVPPPGDATVPQPGGVLGGSAGQQPPPDPIKEDQKKRAYLSLFAPNVAFTSRKVQGDMQTAVGMVQTKLLNESAPAASTPKQAASSSPDVTGSPDPASGKRYVVFEGTMLEALLINRLNGTFSGPVNCLVTTDLYSHDRQHVLIPAGTKVLGEAKKVEAFGQQRLAVYFHRLIMPDGYSVNLDQYKGLNQAGETALRDKVNNHYIQIFGASLAIGILGGVAEAGTGNVLTNSAVDRMREGFGASLATSSMNVLDRFLNILPTVTIREGNRVKVYFAGDLLLPDYAEHGVQPNL
jgi:type IV secretion system protein TrbI